MSYIRAIPYWVLLLSIAITVATPTSCLGLNISDVATSSESFSPSQNQEVCLLYSLDKSSHVTINVYDPDFHLVKILLENGDMQKGEHRICWDGRDQAGHIVPDEAYFFTIVAVGIDGEQDVYDPTTFSGGEQFDITEADVDLSANTINYNLEKPSRILIRAGVSAGPLLHIPVNWRPRVSGEITDYWNGRDQDDLANLLDFPRFKLLITGFALVENSVIAYGNTADDYFAYAARPNDGRPKKPPRASMPRGQSVTVSPHYLRPRVLDKAVDVGVSFPQDSSNDLDVVVLSDASAIVRVDLSQEAKSNFIDEPFEISFFLDGEYYSEEEVGYTPYNWMWNLGDIEDGEYLLTVNLSSFKDIIGIKSRKIKIERKTQLKWK